MAIGEELLEKITRGLDNTGECAVAEIRDDSWPEEVSMIISLDRGIANALADLSDLMAKYGNIGSEFSFMTRNISGMDVILGAGLMFNALSDEFRKGDDATEEILANLRGKKEATVFDGPTLSHGIDLEPMMAVAVNANGITFKKSVLADTNVDLLCDGPFALTFGREEFREKMENAFRESPAPRM